MSRSRTEQFFDDYAEGFDALYESRRSPLLRLLDKFLRKSMRLRFERTLSECQPVEGLSVLDIGCGPGQYAIALARMGASKVVGIDFSEQMIDLAKKRAESEGLTDRCSFIKTGIDAFKAVELFDYCIATGFMDYISEPEVVIAKILELTASKAIFSFPVASGILAWQRRIRYRRRCDLFMYDRPELERLFSESGDFNCTIDKIHRDYVVIAKRVNCT